VVVEPDRAVAVRRDDLEEVHVSEADIAVTAAGEEADGHARPQTTGAELATLCLQEDVEAASENEDGLLGRGVALEADCLSSTDVEEPSPGAIGAPTS
jgi:hypothetical protein